MENCMTVKVSFFVRTNDEAVVLYDESVFEEDDNTFEGFDEFPTKNHRNVARRKKAFFKSKHRFDILHSLGLEPRSKQKSKIRGFLRKTNVLNHKCYTPYVTSMSNIRRLASANNKLSEYFMEE